MREKGGSSSANNAFDKSTARGGRAQFSQQHLEESASRLDGIGSILGKFQHHTHVVWWVTAA